MLRKLAHVIEFFILTLLAISAFSSQWQNKKAACFASAVLISILYAISDEYHQTFVFGRSGSLVDAGIDSLGIFSAALIRIVFQKNVISHIL